MRVQTTADSHAPHTSKGLWFSNSQTCRVLASNPPFLTMSITHAKHMHVELGFRFKEAVVYAFEHLPIGKLHVITQALLAQTLSIER
jgi:hypothetical protein